MARGILDRLAAPERSARPLDVRESIAEHLRVLLNTRQGNAGTTPDFGIVDFADVVHAMPGSLASLQASIRAVVLRYEPRLRNVVVRHQPSEDPLQLRFEITAQLAERYGTGTLRFQTRMRAGGRVDVQG